MIVLLAAAFMGEPIRPAQGLAVALAFAGVLIVLQPTGDGFKLAALIPLVSALAYAFSALLTRARLREADAWALTLSLTLVMGAIGAVGIGVLALIGEGATAPFLTRAWPPLDARALTIVMGLAVISIGVHVLLARAYQRGPTAVVAGLDYAYLGFAALWTFLLFGATPSLTTVIGATLIAAAGGWNLHCAARDRRAGTGVKAAARRSAEAA